MAAAAALIVVITSVAVWRLTGTRPTPVDPLATKTRVVVLPFQNLTGDHRDDWLASAFSDSLTMGLQDNDELICVSRDRILELYSQQSLNEASAANEKLSAQAQIVSNHIPISVLLQN